MGMERKQLGAAAGRSASEISEAEGWACILDGRRRASGVRNGLWDRRAGGLRQPLDICRWPLDASRAVSRDTQGKVGAGHVAGHRWRDPDVRRRGEWWHGVWRHVELVPQRLAEEEPQQFSARKLWGRHGLRLHLRKGSAVWRRGLYAGDRQLLQGHLAVGRPDLDKGLSLIPI